MFNWFRKNVGKKEPNILIKRELQKKGILFYIYLELEEEKKLLNLPIPYTHYFNLKNLSKKDFYISLQILENLYNSCDLKKNSDGSYFIETNNIYGLEEELINLLDFETDESLKVKIIADLPVGSTNFSLSYQVYHPNYKYISNFHDRTGAFFPVSTKKSILLNSSLVKLLDLVDKPPTKREDQLKYVAKIKSMGKKLGVEFDDYLMTEEYYFPDELDIDIKEFDIEQIKLQAKFSDLPEELNDEAKETLLKDREYSTKKDKTGKKNRMFFDHNVKKDYKKIVENDTIRGTDVPKFIENPGCFLPDSINLEKFSERVKGLKERVYKAQPYIRSKQSDKINWFDLDIGVNLKELADETSQDEDEDEDEGEDEFKKGVNSTDDKVSVEKFKELVEEARKNNEDYVLWQGKWVKIPKDSEDFIKATEETKKISKDGKVNKSQLPFIFDIYENVDRLEYSLDLLKKRDKFKEEGLMEYKKPKLLNGDLYSYQQDGYVWLNRLQMYFFGGLLADDMGLGKTVQIIAYMAQLKEKNTLTPSLIIAPASLLLNWSDEINKFCPKIEKIYIHSGGDRCKDSKIIKKSEVVITTYQTLVRDQLILGEIDWQLIVCDEAQNINNQSTYAAHAVKAQKTKLRLALTGTPVENGLSDLWSIIDYAQPGLLDSFSVFKKNYIKPLNNCTNQEQVSKYEQKLISKIKPIYLRRTKEEELKEMLPDKYEKVQEIEMSPKQKNLYERIRNSYISSNRRNHLQVLQQLISLCSHPGLIEKDWQYKNADELIEEGSKLKVLIDILKKIKSKNEKAIIFTTYIKMQLIIERVVREVFNINYIPIINGSSKGRLETVNNFNNSFGFNCMILSPKAAGVGLNITGANHVIHYTRWWNPAVEQQATDRAYRIGQKKDVIVYYPIVIYANNETVEEKLNTLLMEKRKLAKSIIVPNKKVSDNIYRELYTSL